jgi:hypothetical protein
MEDLKIGKFKKKRKDMKQYKLFLKRFRTIDLLLDAKRDLTEEIKEILENCNDPNLIRMYLSLDRKKGDMYGILNPYET